MPTEERRLLECNRIAKLRTPLSKEPFGACRNATVLAGFKGLGK
jgi:hypothetical protein